MKQYPNWEVHREGNNWDVFLNYFFAVLFLCCLVVGIFLNPFIIIYHSRQKKTFATFLFLLVSSIDQFKSLYFPLVFIPKLLSPLDDEDYYHIYDEKEIPWTGHSNNFFLCLVNFEMNLLVVLCVARYKSIKNPLSSSRKRNIVFSTALILSFLLLVPAPLLLYFHGSLGYMRVIDLVHSMNLTYTEEIALPLVYLNSGVIVLFLLVGGCFSILTIVHLKNSDPASSETSSKNIRRGIVSLVAMNLFNVFVLLCLRTILYCLQCHVPTIMRIYTLLCLTVFSSETCMGHPCYNLHLIPCHFYLFVAHLECLLRNWCVEEQLVLKLPTSQLTSAAN